MIIGIFSDLHLGVRQYGLKEREEDFYFQYNTAIDTFVEQEVDAVILAGDSFDQPRPAPKTLKVFSDGIRKLIDNNIQILFIDGNHTMINSKKFVTADEFLQVTLNNNKYVRLSQYKYFEKDDVIVAGLPYHYDHDMSKFIERVNTQNDLAGLNDGVNILVLHQSFREYCGFAGETLSIHDIETSNFDLIICGHIHERKLAQVNDKTIFLQPGSLERLSIAEARDEENNGKGIYIIDTETMDIDSIANGFIHLHNPRKFLIMDSYTESRDDIPALTEEILQSCKKYSVPPLLFLTVHDKSESYPHLMEMVASLKDDFLTVNFNYFDESEKMSDIVIDAKDMPSPREVLKIALNPLDEEEATLGLELYDMLSKNEDPTDLLNDFKEKRFNKANSESSLDYNEEEIEELRKYFE